MAEEEPMDPESCSRISVFKETLFRRWVVLTEVILLFIHYGDLIGKVFPEAERFFVRLAFLSELPWHWKVISLLFINFLLMWEGAFRAIRKREKQRHEYRVKLQEIEDAKPNIVLRDPGAEQMGLVALRGTDGRIVEVPFATVRFVNKPIGNFPNSEAHGVIAQLTFSDPSGNVLLEMDGRWSDSDQPSTRTFGKSRNDLLKMDFQIGAAHSVDVAFWSNEKRAFIAWNNDSYDFPGGGKPNHILQGNEITVRIELKAAWVDQTFLFQLTADGKRAAIRRRAYKNT